MAIKRYIGIGKETTYGSIIAPTRYIESIEQNNPDQGWIIPPSIGQRALRKKNLGPYRTSETLGAFDVEPENIGELLLGAIGSVTTTNPYSGVYNHQFTPADTLPSFTMRIGSEIIERILPGCLVNSLQLQASQEGNIKAIAEIFSGFVESNTSLQSAIFSPLQAFNFLSDPTANYLKLAGVNKQTQIYDLSIKIDNKIPFRRGALDSRMFSTKRVGSREITGKLSLFFDDTTQYNAFIAGSEFSIEIICYGPVFAAGQKYKLEIYVPKCIYTGAVPKNEPMDEPIKISDASFKGFYNEVVGAEIVLNLTNGVSSY